MCVAERIADYCEAVLAVSSLCKTGLRCCVSKDSYGDNPHLVLMDRNSSTTQPPSITPAPSPRPGPAIKPCRGECVSGLFALFCDDIDTQAHCPGDDSCCITSPATPEPPAHPRPAATSAAPATTTTTTQRPTSSLAPLPKVRPLNLNYKSMLSIQFNSEIAINCTGTFSSIKLRTFYLFF